MDPIDKYNVIVHKIKLQLIKCIETTLNLFNIVLKSKFKKYYVLRTNVNDALANSQINVTRIIKFDSVTSIYTSNRRCIFIQIK